MSLSRSIYQREDQRNSLVIIQCQSGHLHGELIACARYRIGDERLKSMQQMPTSSQHVGQSYDLQKPPLTTRHTYVLFIIYLPRQTPPLSFVGFQGDPWSSVHIDELRETDEEVTSFEFFEHPISSLLYSPMGIKKPSGSHCIQYNFHKRLHSCIQSAVARITSITHDRGIKLVTALFDLIPEVPLKYLGMGTFHLI